MDRGQRWSELYFDLTFEMTELLAKAELVTGNFDGCKEATMQTILRAKSTEMKINSLILDVTVRTTSYNDLNDFLNCAQSALHAVGVKMPSSRVTKRHVLIKFMKVKRMMRKKTDKQILGLPVMTDKLASTAITILSHVLSSCFMQDETDLALYAALRSLELTLIHGITEGTSLSLMIYAVVEFAVGNRREAYRYAKLGLTLTESISSCVTVGYGLALITWRKEQLAELRKHLLATAEIGFQVGHTIVLVFQTIMSCTG